MDWLQFAPFASVTIADLLAAAPAVALCVVFVAGLLLGLDWLGKRDRVYKEETDANR